jgi:hypothetical protein
MRNKDVKDIVQINDLLKKGHYIEKELEALYKLRKYRAMKNRYY